MKRMTSVRFVGRARGLPLLVSGLLGGCVSQPVRVSSGAQTSSAAASLAADLDVCTVWGKRGVETDQWLADGFRGKNEPFFRAVKAQTSMDEVADCDVAVRITMDRKMASAQVFSAYSKESLLSLDAPINSGAALWDAIRSQGSHMLDDSAAGRLGAAVFKTVSENKELYVKIKSQREVWLANKNKDAVVAGLAKGGLSKIDLAALTSALTAGAAAAPNSEEKQSLKTSDVDRPHYSKLPERPDDFALVIGIDKYSALPAAPYAERDADAVKNHLIAQGFPARNVILLTGSKATRTGISKYLVEWLPRNVKETSRVFFYFSGHGAPDVDTQQAYLVPWDGDANFLESTALPIKGLYAQLGGLRSKQVIVAMDSCFSGAGGRSVIARGARPLVTKVDADRAAPEKFVVFSAANASQITSSLEEEGHGIFTYYFLKGFGGDAKDAAGRVTASSLYQYLRPKVADEARRQNREQEPMLQAAAADSILVQY